MRVLIDTYFDLNQALDAGDQFRATTGPDEEVVADELLWTRGRWRLGIAIDQKQMEFDFEGPSSL